MITLFGIDPGSNHLGLTVLKMEDETFKIAGIETHHIDVSKLKSTNKFISDISIRLISVRRYINKLIKFHDPQFVAIESSFFNIRRPSAVIPLAKSLGIIEDVLSFARVPYQYYSPTQIKKLVGGHGKDDKDAVLKSVLKLDDFTKFFTMEELEVKTDHEIDSLAIVYILRKSLINHPQHLIKQEQTI